MTDTTDTGTDTPGVPGTPALGMITETESGMTTTRKINTTKVDCGWCDQRATLVVTDEYGSDLACQRHADLYFPPSLPGAEGAEYVVPLGVTLDKAPNATTDLLGLAYPPVPRHPNPLPVRRLYEYRPALRANDMIALRSAFVCLAIAGGTAHLSHCGCANCQGRFN